MNSEKIKGLTLNLSKQGKCYGEIGNILQLSKSAVQNLTNYQKSWHKKTRGPKYTINKRKSTILKTFIKKGNESGKKVNATKIMRTNDLSCSRRTVSRWFKKNDYKFQKEAQQIMLSQKHKSERIFKISS